MAREIKFRAWDKGNQQMIYPLPIGTLPSGQLLLRWDDESLMQFTGLKDKNGKEIYEGDIVLAELTGFIKYNMKCVISFNEGCFGITSLKDEVLLDSKGKFKSFDGCITEHRIDIIGNIHENPELLIN